MYSNLLQTKRMPILGIIKILEHFNGLGIKI